MKNGNHFILRSTISLDKVHTESQKVKQVLEGSRKEILRISQSGYSQLSSFR